MVLLREVAGRLQAQVKQTTQAVNRLHNLLARVFPELATLTQDIATGWVLRLLDQYPTAELIAAAPLASLEKIPSLSTEQAHAVQQAAGESVATLKGSVAEVLIRNLVTEVRHAQTTEKTLRKLLISTFDKLPSSSHIQVVTVPGIGAATAAVLVAKVVDIKRFPTPDHLVSYLGLFPEENSSGVDKYGNPLPPGTMHMSRKGNDLARGYLWNAARTAIRCNPAVRALYRRLKAKGKRGDVAMGPCMCKLVHLVFAVWTTNRPFDPAHFPWEGPAATSGAAATDSPASGGARTSGNKAAVGHKRDEPAGQVVTTAPSNVEPTAAGVKPQTPPSLTARPQVDFRFLRQQVTMKPVLEHLGLMAQLRGSGAQRRGPCPIHSHPGDQQRTFSVHLDKNAFQCFQADCGAKGNALDLWAAVHRLPLYDAALHLAETLGIPRNREEEPVKGTR
jgi:transposase